MVVSIYRCRANICLRSVYLNDQLDNISIVKILKRSPLACVWIFPCVFTNTFLFRYVSVGCHHVHDSACKINCICPLLWRHNGPDSISNHQFNDCLFNRLIRRRSKKTSRLRVTVLCAGNSPGTGEFPAQMASNAENVSIWWRHHAK